MSNTRPPAFPNPKAAVGQEQSTDLPPRPPEFLRRDPDPLSGSEAYSELESKAIQGGEAIVHIIQERDRYRQQATELDRELIACNARIDELQRREAFISSDRDRLARAVAELQLQLNNIHMFVADAQKRVREATGRVPRSEDWNAQEQSQLEQLARTLQPEGLTQ